MPRRRPTQRRDTSSKGGGRTPANTAPSKKSGTPDPAHVDVNPSRGPRAFAQNLALGGLGVGAAGVGIGFGGKFAGEGLAALGEGAGEGIGAGLSLSLEGLGQGFQEAGEGVSEGLTSLLPFLLIGGIAFLATRGGA